MATAKEQIAGLTRDDLLALVEAIRKPVKTEKEIREEAQALVDRQNMMDTLKRQRENTLANQKNCSHMRNNGSTTAVYIVDLNKLYCQVCQKWIVPHQEPELFNKLYPLAI